MKILYIARATSIAGRNGHSQTDDGQISVDMVKPESGKKGTNPEQLFACGYSACFGSAIESVAKKKGVNTGEIKVQADISLNQDDIDGYFLSVVISATLSGANENIAQEIVQAAHKVCPYSKAIRGNVNVEVKANGRPLAMAA